MITLCGFYIKFSKTFSVLGVVGADGLEQGPVEEDRRECQPDL